MSLTKLTKLEKKMLKKVIKLEESIYSFQCEEDSDEAILEPADENEEWYLVEEDYLDRKSVV